MTTMTDTLSKSNSSESAITALILKGASTTSATDRDAGFCSGGDEDDLEIEDEIHSPTDASEDSVEVKVTPISSRNKNKRKCAEPRKVPNDEIVPTGPLKKRIRFEMKHEEARREAAAASYFDSIKNETIVDIKHQESLKPESETLNRQSSPFRPWSNSSRPVHSIPIESSPPSPNYHPVYGYQQPTIIHQEEPLSLVKTKAEPPQEYHHHYQQQQQRKYKIQETISTSNQVPEAMIIRPKEFAKIPIKVEPPRVPPHPAVRPPTVQEMEELIRPPKSSPGFTVESLLSAKAATAASSSSQSIPSTSISSKHDKPEAMRKEPKEPKEQRNYKNMTRERRIEANARERTRVHTISAAFDTLRRAIPAYSHNQKLSKLSVLRIACSYILTLSRVAGEDYSADQSAPPLADCVDLVSRTIQTEGKLRKKKDE